MPSSTTDSGTVDFGTQVVLSPAFEGCGRLIRYNVTAVCGAKGNNECNIVFQLWRPRRSGVFTLINSAMDSYNPPGNSDSTVHKSLTFPLDIEFTSGDMVGFFHDVSGRHPLEVHRASAVDHSYLLWSSVSTMRSMLTTEDATTVTSQLPILNVEGNYTIYLYIMHSVAALPIVCMHYLLFVYILHQQNIFTVHPVQYF